MSVLASRVLLDWPLPNAVWAGLAACAVLSTGCDARVPAGEHRTKETAVSVLQEDAGGALLQLDPTIQRRLDLRAAPAESVTLPRTAEGYARVLDPTALVELVAAERTAHASHDTVTRELARLRQLVKSENVSLRALESAESSQKRSEAEWLSTRAKLTIAWGPSLLRRGDLDQLIVQISAGEKALVRVDVPVGESVEPTSIQLASIGDSTWVVSAELIGNAAVASDQFQGSGFLAVTDATSPRIVPGAFLIAHLELAGPPVSGVRVPPSAVVHRSGKTWVYVQTGAAQFARREIQLTQSTAVGWIVTGGITSGDSVVTTGAQALLSSEGLTSLGSGD